MLNAELLSMTDPKEVNEYYSQPTSFATMYEITLKTEITLTTLTSESSNHHKTSPVLSKADSKDPFGYGQVREEIFNKRPRAKSAGSATPRGRARSVSFEHDDSAS